MHQCLAVRFSLSFYALVPGGDFKRQPGTLGARAFNTTSHPGPLQPLIIAFSLELLLMIGRYEFAVANHNMCNLFIHPLLTNLFYTTTQTIGIEHMQTHII